ncbi:MAG: sulfatase-like hydrolase/transferase [Verrucomicrobiota bacterium]|nr:sulfatase-like hydrolase/transferase [Verrucomicrobiota bacterium]
MNLNTFFQSALVVLSTTVLVKPISPKAESKPNILIIMVDDLGYGDLSSYGAKDLQSPYLDSLMSEGIRFDSFYANCPVCSPTRAALLSGTYPDIAGVPGVIRTHPQNNWGWLSPNLTLLPSVLKKGGYHTSIIGKWHLGLEEPNTPNGRGFDYFKGFLCDMIDDYYKHRRHGINYFRENRKEIDPPGHATDLITKWGIDYVNSRKEKNEPFFMFLSYNAPHTPIQPPQDWLEKVKERESGISNKRAKLVALIEHMDHGIGQVINTLKKNGQFKNTLTIFTSDNGGQVNVGGTNGNHRGGKQDMYEGGLKVPTCAVWPDKIKAGTKSKLIGITMDLYPTVCEAAGVKTPKYIEGKSILPTMLSKPQIIERDLVFVRREGGLKYNGQDYHAFRRGNWKLVHNSPFEAYELYNLKDDPLESNNLANTNREKFIELTTALRLHYQRAGKTPWQKPTN